VAEKKIRGWGRTDAKGLGLLKISLFIEIIADLAKPQENQATEGGDVRRHEILKPPGNQESDARHQDDPTNSHQFSPRRTHAIRDSTFRCKEQFALITADRSRRSGLNGRSMQVDRHFFSHAH
jgi:hypothetical protein